jgi:hypothetical protein
MNDDIADDPFIPVKLSRPSEHLAESGAPPPTIADMRRIASSTAGPEWTQEARLALQFGADELERLTTYLDCLYGCPMCKAHLERMKQATGAHDAEDCAAVIAVILWNEAHPPGTSVAVKLIDDGPEYATQTRSEAWACSGQAVVLIEGRTGGHSVAHLRPLAQGEHLPPIPARDACSGRTS